MTTYNVVSPGAMVAGQPEDISVVLANFNAIAAILNGGIDNANVNSAAAIAYSKLALAGGIVNADIASGAAILASKLAGYPSDATKSLMGDGSWAAALQTLRKTTSKAVNTTTSPTDLLNGEITLPALTATKVVRLTACGDWLNNSGGAVVQPRFQLALGGTTFIDTNTPATTVNSSATRAYWWLRATISNLGATNSQFVSVDGWCTFAAGLTAGAAIATFTTGQGSYNQQSGLNGHIVGANSGLAVDTATAKLLALNAINGSASASYETRLLSALVEIL